jgi:uncharacterized protein YceK
MKKFILLLCGIVILTGCSCIIDHFDGKYQAYVSTMKYHAKLHKECGKSMFCKRLNREIGISEVWNGEIK